MAASFSFPLPVVSEGDAFLSLDECFEASFCGPFLELPEGDDCFLPFDPLEEDSFCGSLSFVEISVLVLEEPFGGPFELSDFEDEDLAGADFGAGFGG